MTICLVTDRRQLSPEARTDRDEARALARFVEDAIAAGVDLIQLREPDLPPRLLGDLARAVQASAKGTRTRVVINDRADIAWACDCDGVHLRADGPPIDRVRSVARGSSVARPGSQGRGNEPRSWIIGRSVHSVDEAGTNASADYLLFGAVFESGAKPARGVEALRSVVDAIRSSVSDNAPEVIAIGGITVERAAQCMNAGADGVAAIRLFLPPGRATGALGVATATRELRRAFGLK